MKKPLLLLTAFAFVLPLSVFAWGGSHSSSTSFGGGSWSHSGSSSFTGRYGNTYNTSHSSSGTYGGCYHYGGVGYGGCYGGGFHAGYVGTPVGGAAVVRVGPYARGGYYRRW